MASVCATPIKGTVYRVIMLDTCGNPVTGAGSKVVVSNSFTQVAATPQYEAGTDYFERGADGNVVVNDIDPPILKRYQIQTDIVSIDPDMLPLTVTARELVSTTPVSGYGFVISEGISIAHFSLEVWQKVAGAGACAPGGVQRYIYNCWPHCRNGQLSAYTIANARSALSFTCDTAGAGSAWQAGAGSTSWLPTGQVLGVLDHYAWNISTIAPPNSGCGAVVLT